MSELAFVRSLKRLAPGIGDDCAILPSPGPELDLLVTTDMFVRDVHFRLRTHTAHDVGYIALARAVSDIAAMGGDPRWYFVSAAFEKKMDARWRRNFVNGHARAAAEFSVSLAGGDTSHSAVFACDITVIGTVPRGQAIARSGARPGDFVYVSGLLGRAAVKLRSGKPCYPAPRLSLGRFLRGKATACMDLSDGLSTDLHRLTLESGVAARLVMEPPGAKGSTFEDTVHGGEDYELLFTAPRGLELPVKQDGIPLTRIGTIVEGRAGSVMAWGEPLRPSGYDHLS